MKNENLELLVQKYMNAESNQEEENRLRNTLSSNDGPEEYADLKALFGYFELQKSQTFIPDFNNPALDDRPAGGRVINLRWIAAAASVAVLIVAAFLFTQRSTSPTTDTFQDPVIAAESAIEALQLLSGELNKGQDIAREQFKEFDNINKYLNIY